MMDNTELLAQLKQHFGLDLPDEEAATLLEDFWKSLPASERDKAELARRAKIARENFTVEGFKHFFWCIWRRECAPYADTWIESFMGGQWTILECFRGSTKSTTLTITFSAFVLGHFPQQSVLIVQANDQAASKTSAAIANIISLFSGWAACFPNVMPDEKRGWGANGYFIQDTDVVKESGYGAWVEKTMQDHTKDPSFVGAGITSADIVGMHPRWLFFDDIHDKQNSTYPKDRENIVSTVRENVIPVNTKPGGEKPFFGVACTFWDKSDAYHVLLETGLFQHIKTPIFWYDEKGTELFEGKPIRLAWQDGYPLSLVELYRRSNDAVTFKREYLCDETSELDRAYKVMSHRSEQLDFSWQAGLGADPVGVLNAGEGISHFAALEGLLTPYNYLVIVDGILEKCGALEGEEYIVNAHGRYVNFQKAVIEGNGIGAIFASTVTRHPGVIVQTVKVQEIGKGSKLDRQYQFLEPLARTGMVRVSDANTPILRAVRRYFDEFPNFDKNDPLADLGDALVLLVYGFPVIWTRNVTSVAAAPQLKRNVQRVVPALGSYRHL
jgi:hypothetical protein